MSDDVRPPARQDALLHADQILNFQQIFERGPVGDTLQRDKEGNFTLTNAEVFNRIFHPDPNGAEDVSAALRAGGDSVRTYIEQGAIWQVRSVGAIGDGVVDVPALTTWIKQHAGALSMLPGLCIKLETALKAQIELDKLRMQKHIADDIKNGALRNRRGLITRSSFMAWFYSNESVLRVSQSPHVLAWLQSLGNKLPERPGGIAGFLSSKFRAAYSEAIERAIFDAKYAAKLTAIHTSAGASEPVSSPGAEQEGH